MRRPVSRASPDAGRNYEELGKIILQNLESCISKNSRILADIIGKNPRIKANCNFANYDCSLL